MFALATQERDGGNSIARRARCSVTLVQDLGLLLEPEEVIRGFIPCGRLSSDRPFASKPLFHTCTNLTQLFVAAENYHAYLHVPYLSHVDKHPYHFKQEACIQCAKGRNLNPNALSAKP